MINTEQAQKELDNLKDKVIGIFKGHLNAPYELIVKCNKDTIDTIHITVFGAIQESYGMPKHYGKVALFGKNKSMNDVLKNPFEWSEFIESNFQPNK